MANQQEIEEVYDFMDEIFRLSFGEHADLTCAMISCRLAEGSICKR